ncbi:MAG: alpha/beta hydrolase fold domain-containing protein [Novosphingobium sp.]
MDISRRDFAGLSIAAAGSALVAPGPAIAAVEAGQGEVSGGGGGGDGILVPQHFVPTPKTISPAAQAMLRMKLPVGGVNPPDSLSDTAGWKAFQEASARGMLAMVEPFKAKYPADVATHQLSAFKLYEVTPKNVKPGKGVMLYIHGGGFSTGGGDAAIFAAMQFAHYADAKVYSVDYRMLPDVQFPVPLDDTLEAYRFVLQRHGRRNVAIYGPSAGANLAAALVLKARDTGVPMPAACAMHSCPSDMSDSGDSANTNYMVDIILREMKPGLSTNYAGKADLKNPYLSPVHGDFSKGYCPTLMTTGTRDLLLSGTVRLHRAMVKAGVQAEIHVWEAMTHAPFFAAPEEHELYELTVNFLHRHLRAA